MLASARTIKVVADALRRFNVKNIVVDPVRSPGIRLSWPPGKPTNPVY